jgi:hypothetical protein
MIPINEQEESTKIGGYENSKKKNTNAALMSKTKCHTKQHNKLLQ